MIQEISMTFPCDCGDITHQLAITPSYNDAGRLEYVFVTVASNPQGLRERLVAAWRALFHAETNVADVVLADVQMHGFVAYCAGIRADSGMGGMVTYTGATQSPINANNT
jgi:hypothetical protein